MPWGTIKCAFPENNSGSRILVTTRIISVAKACCSHNDENVYSMKPLSDADAEKLFDKRVFVSQDECPSQLKDISTDILRKCGGLPLAIITVAGLLASNKPYTKEKWEWYRDSIAGSTTETFSIVQRILSLSYNDLPHSLKTCLLYLSTFPEDSLIWRDSLVRRWIAEGFVNAEREKSLMEVGKSYFNELINRSLIQPVKMECDGQSYACRVHDMILELIISKSIKEKFITFGLNHVLQPQDKVRRLSLDYRDHDITVPSTVNFSSTRSLITYGSTECMPPLSDFLVLRVIALEGNDKLENCYLNDIGRLFQLKYLKLSEVSISELPKQISRLQQLETLELRRTRVKELPKGIVMLNKLITLIADDIILPQEIDKMKALQRLCGIRVNSSSPPDSLRKLAGLTELVTLRITWSISDMHSDQPIYTANFISCIDQLCRFKLRYLNMGCESHGASLDFLLGSWPHPPYHLFNFRTSTYYCFPRTPEWMASLVDLTFLDTNFVTVGGEALDIIGSLPSLLSLVLYVQKTMPQRLIVSRGGFQSLKEFYFHSWSNEIAGQLLFEVGAMPRLENFRTKLSAQMTEHFCCEFYNGLHNIVRLKNLCFVIDCRGPRAHQVEAIEAVLRHAIADNPLPSHVHIEYRRIWVAGMLEQQIISNTIAKHRDEADEGDERNYN